MTLEVGRTGELAARLNALYTAVVADVLDRLGYRDQTFRAEIRPLFPGARIAGVARTVEPFPPLSSPRPNHTRGKSRPSTLSGQAT